MKKVNLVQLVLIASFLIFSCSQQSESAPSEKVFLEVNIESEEIYGGGYVSQNTSTTEESSFQDKKQEVEKISTVNKESISSSLANQKNTKAVISSKAMSNPFKNKKFIKTSNLKFKVKDVYSSTVAIENILISNDGFLLNSNLNAQIVRSETFVKNKEWNIRFNEFVTTNYMTLRVPNENLHETLLQLADEISFLDYRHLNAEDVGLTLLEQELAEKRAAQSQVKIQTNINAGGKLEDKTAAEQIAYYRQKEEDLARLKQLSLEDQVTYSTITLEIYQDAEMTSSEVPNFEIYREEYKTPFSSELKEALVMSVNIIKGFLLFLFGVWPILIVIVAIGFLVRKIGFKK